MTLTVILSIFLSACAGQNKQEYTPRLIGNCEGCEAVFEYGNKALSSIDTLPGFQKEGPQIKISGTIYKSDGETPASNVILYVYHTDQKGIYPPADGATDWARRHGYIRTWLKTDQNGHYEFYTLKPASYPNTSIPAHIHATILEPDGKYYWIADFHFADDPYLSERERSPKKPRGGGGNVLSLQPADDWWVGERDIVLGRNVSGWE